MENPGSFIIEIELSSQQSRMLPLDQFEIQTEDRNKIYWVHADLNQIGECKVLYDKLNLSDEVRLLCADKDLRIKLVDEVGGLTLQLQPPLSYVLGSDGHTPVDNLLIHLTNHFCFTASWQLNFPVKELWKHYSKAIRFAETPCFLLFLLLDETINVYSNLLFEFQLLIEQIDLNIAKATYEEVVALKRQFMKSKRFIGSIRDLLMRISARKIAVISESCRLSLQKLLGNTEILVHEAESILDLFHTMLEQIDNALMQQANNIMKVLTGVAAIFLPPTLIAGIFGMNLRFLPGNTWKYSFFYVLGLMVVCVSGQYLLFKKMRWF